MIYLVLLSLWAKLFTDHGNERICDIKCLWYGNGWRDAKIWTLYWKLHTGTGTGTCTATNDEEEVVMDSKKATATTKWRKKMLVDEDGSEDESNSENEGNERLLTNLIYVFRLCFLSFP